MSWSVLASYIAGYFYVCSSSFYNATQCLKVWEYMPAYINDLTEFKSSTPYQSEQDYIKSWHESDDSISPGVSD